MIVKTGCGTDGALHSANKSMYLLHNARYLGLARLGGGGAAAQEAEEDERGAERDQAGARQLQQGSPVPLLS